MKLTLDNPKPRNPFVALARRRAAGRHGGESGRLRQSQRRELQGELARLKPSP
jgi:hypothetical protein